MVALAGMVDGSVYDWIARVSSAVTLWATVRARKADVDPLEDLTFRLRHPVRWAVKHPIEAVERFFRS